MYWTEGPYSKDHLLILTEVIQGGVAVLAEITWVEPKFLLLRRAMPRCATSC